MPKTFKSRLGRMLDPHGKLVQKGGIRKGAYRESVKKRFGKAGLTQRGTIKMSVINNDITSAPSLKTRRRAVLAKNARVMRKTDLKPNN